MTTQQKIIKKIAQKAKKAPEIDHRFSTKVKKAGESISNKAKEVYSKVSDMDAMDKAAGELVEKAGDKAKSVGRAVGVTADKVKRTGSWIKKHPIKTAAGAGAVYAAGKAISGDDDEAKTIRKIKAKPASERTAAERRLLRIMEED